MLRRKSAQALFVIVILLLMIVVWRQQVQSAPATPPTAATQPEGDHDRPDLDDLRPASTKERQAAVAAIQAQLDAFRKDDYPRALIYQSQNLRSNFPTADSFRRMMQAHYPEFAHYKSVQYGSAVTDLRRTIIIVPVILTGQNGNTVKAIYHMVKEKAGYRVEGVTGGSPPPPPPTTES